MPYALCTMQEFVLRP